MNEQGNIENIIVRYLTGSITDCEHSVLTSWLSLSAENQQLFDQVREIWLASKQNSKKFQFDSRSAFERFKKKTIQNNQKPKLRNTNNRHLITISYRWAVAVVLFAIVGGALFYGLLQKQAIDSIATAYQEITVPYGARSKVLLPDGSFITLNAGTTLRYNVDFGKEHRNLWLDGEGYFVVNKSTTPFIVHSGTVQIKALGTQFNVRAYSSENNIETTLVEGKVSISNVGDQSEQGEELTLLPNQKLIVSKNGSKRETGVNLQEKEEKLLTNHQAHKSSAISVNEIIKQEKIDPLPDISWKDNEWVIYRESLEQLAVKLERRHNITIVFKDEHLKSFRYNGTLPDESLEQVLDVMSMVSPITYSVKGKVVSFSENKNFK